VSRQSFARWLMSKLLGAFLIYILLFWVFPILNIRHTQMIFYEFYGWIIGTLSLADFISYILITPLRIFKRE